jgi:uncharacterized cupin superfamily protein
MKKTNEKELEWKERTSPRGGFKAAWKGISAALGAKPDKGTGQGGHPFDVGILKVPPKCKPWPIHSHSSQWEFYCVISGKGKMRLKSGLVEISAGDYAVCKPGEAHQIINDSNKDLVIQIIADNPVSDIIEYPDSGKWAIKPESRVFRMEQVDYFDGEE